MSGHDVDHHKRAKEVCPTLVEQSLATLADMAHIAAIRLNLMDTCAELWGIALMKLQTNLPNTLPDQNVTLLLFGDATRRAA